MGKPKKNSALAEVNKILAKAKRNNDKGGGARKYGRYKTHPSSMRYKAEMRWEKNKVKRMNRHLRRFPNDKQAERLLSEIR